MLVCHKSLILRTQIYILSQLYPLYIIRFIRNLIDIDIRKPKMAGIDKPAKLSGLDLSALCHGKSNTVRAHLSDVC